MRRLANEHLVDGPRRWLVLRCYMNSAGSARHPLPDHPRVPFAPFRRAFVAAGFEVVDCPPLTPQKKNAADIKLAIDVIEALHGPVRYDEFVIASADSDFTPLLQRLRAADRRTTLLSTFDAVEALTVLADRVVDSRQTQALLRDRGTRAGRHRGADRAPVGHRRSRDRARPTRARRVGRSDGPLHLATLGKELRTDLGDVVEQTRWFGHRTLGRAIQGLAPELQVQEHSVSDPPRHTLPPGLTRPPRGRCFLGPPSVVWAMMGTGPPSPPTSRDQELPMRAIWKGAVSFGLVSVPVKLYAATESHDISFRQVHAKDGGRIKYQRVCSIDGEEVAYADIAKGYETEDGQMVVLDDDDFAELPASSSREIRWRSSSRRSRSTRCGWRSPTTSSRTRPPRSPTHCSARPSRRPTGSRW